MAHWVPRARWIVAVAGVAFAIAVFAGIRRREQPAARTPIKPSDPHAQVETVGATSRQWKGAAENFTVKFDRQLSYPDGRVKLEGVTVYVDDREGKRKFVATGRVGEVGPKQELVNLKEDVTLVSSDGLKVQTSEASYSTAEAIVRAPGPVTFSRGRLAGRGVGMTYDRTNEVLWLREQAAVSLAPDDKGAGRLEVTSGTAGLARKDKYLRFEKDVSILRDNRRIRTDNAVGYLSDDESRLTALDLRSDTAPGGRGCADRQCGSHIEMDGAAAGTLQAMHARDINIKYGDDGEHIERALLSGGGSIQIAGEAGKPGRRIAGDLLDVGLSADSTTVTSLIGRDGVQLEFPADGETPARSVRAAALDSAAGAPGEMKGARLVDNVEYRELVGTPPAPRIVRARILDLEFTAGLRDITDARFSGAVRIEDGDLRATAATAKYQVERGVIDLAGDQAAPPMLTDPRIRVDAHQILLTVDGPKVVAKEAVRSELRADKRDARAGRSGKATRMPGFLDEDQPVNVTADALDYDGAASRAVYRGNARLWQGESAVHGDLITIESESGNLKAEGSVGSTLMVDQTDAKTQQKKKVATVAGAATLDYDDQARRATYTTDAHVNGPQGDLLARKIELYLGTGDNELERVEGYEAVTLRDSGRSAFGDRLSYFAKDERYDMAGGPVRIIEECRESTGRTLTFYKSVDRILVDGQQVFRTRSKSGKDCPEPGRTERPTPGAD